MTNPFDLTSRIAVVAGSAQGMSRAMALAQAEAGADRNTAGTERTKHTIRRSALPSARVATDTDHIDRVFATVDREFGRVDCWLRSWSGEAVWGEAVNCCQNKGKYI
jgi:NAD(P)-dependent dehydrogenase (short-subunit alcohol dehydrogenase family)